MVSTDHRPQLGDLILRARPGMDTANTWYWLDTYRRSWRASLSFVTYAEALAEGHARARADGVALWEDVTSSTSAGPQLRLEVSFRGVAQRP